MAWVGTEDSAGSAACGATPCTIGQYSESPLGSPVSITCWPWALSTKEANCSASDRSLAETLASMPMTLGSEVTLGR